MSSKFLQMKVVHTSAGAMRQNNGTAIPWRLAGKVKYAIQISIFDWDFYENLIKGKIVRIICSF